MSVEAANPLHVLDDIEKGRVHYVDKFIMANDKPVGYDTFLYEQGLTGNPKPHGVDFKTFTNQLKEDNKHDERYMEWSRIQNGESSHDDYAFAGFKERDKDIIRSKGYDNPGSKTDAAPNVAAPSTVRSITSAYAQKRGFHEGWNPSRITEDEIESKPPHLRISSATADPDGVEVSGSLRKTEPIIPEVVEHGLDGLLQHGWQVPDMERAEGLRAFRGHIGTDDTGHDHGGPFRAGHKRFGYHAAMHDRSRDADFVQMGEPDHVPADSYGTENYIHDSTPSQHGRLATQEGGFRALTNRGDVGAAIKAELDQIL